MKLILFHSLHEQSPHVLSVVNWGEMQGDKVKYLTKDGEQLKTIAQLNNGHTSVCDFEDLDLKGSLWAWYKSNPTQEAKPIEIDYSIETGEIYAGNCWHLSLMIDKSGDTVKIKPCY